MSKQNGCDAEYCSAENNLCISRIDEKLKGYQGMDYGFCRPQLAALSHTKENLSKINTAVCVGDYVGEEIKVRKGKFQSKLNLII